MWELPQITILRTYFKIVKTHTFRNFLYFIMPNLRYYSDA
ncbi:hypothetical protein LIL_10563 [Leptospira interrogans serovar Linhai str. 56609]|uniref:Uncharacterized protein n=1 Tax=Leptospira interrogans serovar Hardjo str. Norma TaxID=1279460 RepID=A0A0M5LAI2_LEPIR|nr:hypothetical protein LIL_10563 [Leptospira interrogans serovar Linhai str. 56609]ALE37948.1 hypothetical protein G436_0730 [Leptospira interrogans serovar Hardjo str. Norma]